MLQAENASVGFPTRLIVKSLMEARIKNKGIFRSQKSEDFELKFQVYGEK